MSVLIWLRNVRRCAHRLRHANAHRSLLDRTTEFAIRDDDSAVNTRLRAAASAPALSFGTDPWTGFGSIANNRARSRLRNPANKSPTSTNKSCSASVTHNRCPDRRPARWRHHKRIRQHPHPNNPTHHQAFSQLPDNPFKPRQPTTPHNNTPPKPQQLATRHRSSTIPDIWIL